MPSYTQNTLTIKRAALFFALLLTATTLAAQNNIITVRGTVRDAKTKATIPDVTIYVEGGVLYTKSNGDGAFVIKIPEKMAGKNLVFSSFGYDRDTIPVKTVQKKPNIKLKEGGTVKLSDVVVREYTPQTLITQAVNRIPDNFWTDTTIGTFFYRDIRQFNGELFLFDEMVFDALRVGYDKHNSTTKLHGDSKKDRSPRLIESNFKAILYSRMLLNDSAYLRNLIGTRGAFYLSYSDNDVLVDPVEMPNTTPYLSTSKRDLKTWNFKMETYTDADNTDYYIVTMTKHNSDLGPTDTKVVLTIRKSNLAITKMEHIYNSNQNDAPWPLRELQKKTGIDSVYYFDSLVYHYGYVEGKMTLTSYSKHNLAHFYYSNDTMFGVREQTFIVDNQCVLTSQRRGDATFFDSNNIQPPVQISIFDRQASNLSYNEDFWNQYNFVPLEQAIQKKLEEKLAKKR